MQNGNKFIAMVVYCTRGIDLKMYKQKKNIKAREKHGKW